MLRLKATQLLGEVEGLTGDEILNKDQKSMMPIDETLRELQQYQSADMDMEFSAFEKAHGRINEIREVLGAIVDTMSTE